MILWKYEDSVGIERIGKYDGHHDYGGTDITYRFRAIEDNALSLVSGSRLKRARRLTAEETAAIEKAANGG